MNYIKKEAAELKLDDRYNKWHKKWYRKLSIYPAKSEIGMISKMYLELINNKIREKRQVNLWHNTKSVLE